MSPPTFELWVEKVVSGDNGLSRYAGCGDRRSASCRGRIGEKGLHESEKPRHRGTRNPLGQSEKVQADVLKIVHHGTESSTTPYFLVAVEPSYAVLSE